MTPFASMSKHTINVYCISMEPSTTTTTKTKINSIETSFSAAKFRTGVYLPLSRLSVLKTISKLSKQIKTVLVWKWKTFPWNWAVCLRWCLLCWMLRELSRCVCFKFARCKQKQVNLLLNILPISNCIQPVVHSQNPANSSLHSQRLPQKDLKRNAFANKTLNSANANSISKQLVIHWIWCISHFRERLMSERKK